MGEWRNIDTAPKDGSEVILGARGTVWSGYWENQPNHWDETGWYEEDARQGHYYHRHPGQPSHWQPFPDPPE